MPAYILHECKPHENIQNCQVAVVSMDELTQYSRRFDTFGIKEKKFRRENIKESTLRSINIRILVLFSFNQ